MQTFSKIIEETLLKQLVLSSWNELIIKAFRYIQQIVEMHRGFLDQQSALSKSRYESWAQFLQKKVSEMRTIYGDYLAISPQAVRFFDPNYQQPAVMSDVVRVSRCNAIF